MAVLGSIVLGLLIVMTCVSILGREFNSFFNSDMMQASMPTLSSWVLNLGIKPVTGDFELLENGMPFAIFAFLPLAQVSGAHATVDIFTSRFPPRLLRWMAALTEVTFALVLVAITFKLFEGMQGKMRYNETTYLLQFPLWWGYAFALVAAVVAAAIGVYMACVRIYEAVTGKDVVVADPEAKH